MHPPPRPFNPQLFLDFCVIFFTKWPQFFWSHDSPSNMSESRNCVCSVNLGCHGHVRTVLLAITLDHCQQYTTMSSATMLHSHKRYLLMPIVRAGVGLNILNPPHPISLQPFDVAIISRFANSGQFDNTFLSFADARSPVLCGAGAS